MADLEPGCRRPRCEVGNLSRNAATEFTRSRLRFVPGNTRRRALVLIEPLEQAVQARGKLSGFRLTPRQEEVVVLLLAHGKGVRDIARACGISANAAKEHVADVYHRLGEHSREALLARLTGTTSRE